MKPGLVCEICGRDGIKAAALTCPECGYDNISDLAADRVRDAAPELLKALKNCAEVLRHEPTEAEGGDDVYRALYLDAIKAIAKAEGLKD